MDSDDVSFFVPAGQSQATAQFTFQSVVPSGGFTLLVRAQRDGQWWLLKGLKPQYRDDATCQEMLRKEYEILQQAQGDGVVSVEGMETVDGLGECIVMEWVDGMTLGDWLDMKPSQKTRRRVAEELIVTLHRIHALQVVHRDLKPSNIMVTRNGQHVCLIDFGLADTDNYALFKEPAGTRGYISPEQLQGRETDVRNDLYSLGKILLQMRLGLFYNLAARRCLKPIDKRWHDATAITRAVRSMRWALIVLIVLMLTAVGLYVYQQKAIRDSLYTEVFSEFRVGNLQFKSWGGPTVSVGLPKDRQGRTLYLDSVVVVPKSVEHGGKTWIPNELGFNCFAGDTVVTTVYLPCFEGGALLRGSFKGCTRLRDLYFVDETPPAFGTDRWLCQVDWAFDLRHFQAVTLHVPQGRAAAYRKSPWGRFRHIVEWKSRW